jgi:DNA repair exonuclease SbcCD nuclease subunit
MKYVLVGDIHNQITSMKDVEKLFQVVASTAAENEARTVIFMGDLFHTHSVLRQEIIQSYRSLMMKLKDHGLHTIIIVGNHDGSSPSSVEVNAIRLTLNDVVDLIVDKPVSIEAGTMVMIPFIKTKELFVSTANELAFKAKALFCHQTFDGSHYENGFYAPDGIDQNLINIPKIFTGHIHSHEKLGKVFNLGSSRQVTASEANQDKKIWVYDSDINDIVASVSTNTYLRCKHKIVFKSESEIEQYPSTLKSGDSVSLIIDFPVDDKNVVKAKIMNSYQSNFDITPLVSFTNFTRMDKSIDLEKSTKSLEEQFKHYVFEFANIDGSIKEKVWAKSLQLMGH